MKKMVLVNGLTFIRILISLLFSFCVMTYPDKFLCPILLFSLICATDFFDGYLARRFGVQTRVGAIFDVAADMFFVVTSYWALIYNDILPIWILVVAILKFSEFWLTSSIAVKVGRPMNSLFLFDKLGKSAALLLYVLPIVGIISYSIFPQVLAANIITLYDYLVTAMAIVSSIHRIWLIVLNENTKAS